MFVTSLMAVYIAGVSVETASGIGLISFVLGALGTALWLAREPG